jgi:flagellar biosynthesis protein FlhA
MDGAIRFTQRDAMASILITLINIIGGIFIGTIQYGMPVVTAMTTFTIMTVGDGLVTAIPSLLISIAGALVTTRSASEEGMGQEVTVQLFSNPKPVYFSSGIVTLHGSDPGLPEVLVLSLAATLGFIAYSMATAAKNKQLAPIAIPKPRGKAKKGHDSDVATPDKATSFLRMDSLGCGNRLRPDRHRRCSAGLRLPEPHPLDTQADGPGHGRHRSSGNVSDNLKLGPKEYSILLKASESHAASWYRHK